MYICLVHLQPRRHNDLGKLVHLASLIPFSHIFLCYRDCALMNHYRDWYLVLFKWNFVLTEFVLCSEILCSFYRSSAGTVSMCLFYPEFRTKRVCTNETPLYTVTMNDRDSTIHSDNEWQKQHMAIIKTHGIWLEWDGYVPHCTKSI